MKRFSTFLATTFFVAGMISTSCQRSSDEVVCDTKSAGRHVQRGINTLGGKHGESRELRSSDDFDGTASKNGGDDFVSLETDRTPNLHVRDSDQTSQPRETPGELGSQIPGIDAFKDPSLDPELAAIFQNMHFDYNNSLVKGDENLAIAQKIADYLKGHPNVYIFVEGHCDKRGPAAYNLALGANRSNAVRNLLITEGADQEHIFTVSYGKERPLVEGDGEEFYKLNRRAQFRIYERG